MLSKETGIKNIKIALKWYARLMLGRKIVTCLEVQGLCTFEAEY